MSLLYYWSKLFKKLRWKSIINSRVHKSSKIEAGSSFVNSKMDRYSFCGYDCDILNCDIGSFCSIGNRVIIGGEMHPMDWVSMSPVFYDGRDSVKKKFSSHKRCCVKQTVIEHDVWIGQNVMIKQGVRVGVGAVIGMGSVVTKDVDPYCIVGGCPARLIRKRFDDEIISRLLEEKWWNLGDNDLHYYAKYFTSVTEFLSIIKK